MAKLVSFPSGTTERMQKLLRGAKTSLETKRIQCVLLGSLGIVAAGISMMVGYNETYVKRIWIRYREQGEEALYGTQGVGNRNRALLTLEEEDEFLEPYLKKAAKGGILIVKEIHKAYEERFQRRVNNTVIYRLLYRHGWRKIAPRPAHPKTNIIAQNIFRTSFPPEGLGREHGGSRKKTFSSSHVSG
jgi:transposase